MKVWTVVVVSLIVVGSVMFFSFLNGNGMGGFGGLRDEHGCLVAAGYGWNESEQECVRGGGYQVRDFQSCVDAGYSVGESFPRKCSTPGGRSFVEGVDFFAIFSEQLRVRAVANLGAIPIEGFDADMYMDVFPGLMRSDFNGSAAIGGRWLYENDELTFVREDYTQISSADGTLTNAGIMQLYKNLVERLGIDVQRMSDIEEIFRVIEGGENWDEDGIILMRNMQTGEYMCFGCDGELCIDPAPVMKPVAETPSIHCTIGFDLVGAVEEYVPVPQFFPRDPNCPAGQTGRYEYGGFIFKLVDCKPFPFDLGNICGSDAECEFGCVTTKTDLSNIGCALDLCQNSSVFCEGVRGRCGPYGDEEFRIFAPSQVKLACG